MATYKGHPILGCERIGCRVDFSPGSVVCLDRLFCLSLRLRPLCPRAFLPRDCGAGAFSIWAGGWVHHHGAAFSGARGVVPGGCAGERRGAGSAVVADPEGIGQSAGSVS